MKFSGPVQLLTSKFWAGVSDQPASSPGLKIACFSKIYLIPAFLSYRDVTYLFTNLRTGGRKNREPNFCGHPGDQGDPLKVGASENFWISDFWHNIDTP
jgi:hypothetical protein